MEHALTRKKIGLIAGTRIALGIGIGLLLARRLSHRQSKVAGIALACAGAVSTIPLAIMVHKIKVRARHDISSAA